MSATIPDSAVTMEVSSPLLEVSSRPSSIKGERSLTDLEVDTTYFEARMELIGQPATSNQEAQLVTFRTLSEQVHRIIDNQQTPRPATRRR
ncbi:MAG: hypothetical protein WCP34_01425 [Pseudomonadota bacterium]